MSIYDALLVPVTDEGRAQAVKLVAATNIVPFSSPEPLHKLAGLGPEASRNELEQALREKGFEIYLPFTPRPVKPHVGGPAFPFE